MTVKPREVYRGKHKRRNVVAIVLFIFAVLIVGAVVMFYSFQKYLVYGQDGVSLELPILATASPAGNTGEPTAFESVNAEVVVEAPDYSGVEATAGEDLPELRALFVPAADIAAGYTGKYVDLMDDYGANALVLEVRPESGQLIYPSSASAAVSYGLGGTFDLAGLVSSLKDQDIYLTAQISCCVDNLLASRNALISLRNAFGGVYTDSSGNMWLDPYNGDVRQYAADLAAELADMGFDEILLKNIAHPMTGDALVYSEEMSAAPTPIGGVCGFAVSMSAAMKNSSAKLSAILDAESLQGSLSASSGQDITLFSKVFDRLCCFADSAWQYGTNKDLVSPAMTLGDPALRFLPIISYAPEDVTSWIVRIPDGVIQYE